LTGLPEAARVIFNTEAYASVPVPFAYLLKDGEPDIYPEVQAQGYFTIRLVDNHFIFQAGGYVGHIPINDRVLINVQPRVPVRNLERLIHIAEVAPISLDWYHREYEPHEEDVPTLWDALARSLVAAIEDIEANGVYREYVRRDDDTSFPRGRILIGETMRRHEARGMAHLAAVTWFDRSVNNALNRCLKYAIWYLAQRYIRRRPIAGQRQLVSRLNRAYRAFDAAELDRSRAFLRDPTIVDPGRIPDLGAYYRRAVGVAKIIVRDQSVAFGGRRNDVQMESLLLDFEDLFERYVRCVLRQRLQRLAPGVVVLDGRTRGPGGGATRIFDQPLPSETRLYEGDATPDVVLRTTTTDHAAAYPLLVEVKSKPITTSPERDDINQVVTYAVTYRAPTVVLAHPLTWGGKHGLHLVGRIGTLSVWQYGFDLAAQDLEEEEQLFVNAMLDLCPSSVRGS
jgi:5-methylcytosine-specific restriction enzyme subunit McrC